jgi:hypothetical protein
VVDCGFSPGCAFRRHGRAQFEIGRSPGEACPIRKGQRKGPSTHEMEGPNRSSSSDAATSCSTSIPPDPPPSRTPAGSPSCPVPLAFRGAPRVVPVFGSERFLRLSRATAQGVSAGNFKIFSPSTNCPQLSGSYPPVAPRFSTSNPQEVRRRCNSVPGRQRSEVDDGTVGCVRAARQAERTACTDGVHGRQGVQANGHAPPPVHRPGVEPAQRRPG